MFMLLQYLLSFCIIFAAVGTEVKLSTVQCNGNDNGIEHTDPSRRCFFTNLVACAGSLYFVYDPTVSSPPNFTDIYAGVSHVLISALWHPLVLPVDSPKLNNIKQAAANYPPVILFKRLNPKNWYHHLFEDYQPILRMRQQSFGIAMDQRSDHQIVFLANPKQPAPFFYTYSWAFSRTPLLMNDTSLAGLQLPHVVVGTQSMCGHRVHCKLPFEPGTLLKFRRAMLSFLSLEEPLPVEVGTVPRVGVVQRAQLRKFANISSVMRSIGLDVTTKPLFMEELTPIEQARLFGSLDVVVMVHGGAIGNWLFLRPGSVVVEVVPHGYDHNLTDWLFRDLLPLGVSFVSLHLRYKDAVWTEVALAKLMSRDKPGAFYREAARKPSGLARFMAKQNGCPAKTQAVREKCNDIIFPFTNVAVDEAQLANAFQLGLQFLRKSKPPAHLVIGSVPRPNNP